MLAVILLATAFNNAGRILLSLRTSKHTLLSGEILTTSPLLSKPNQMTTNSKLSDIARPGMFDMLGTTLLNFGLVFVVPSIVSASC